MEIDIMEAVQENIQYVVTFYSSGDFTLCTASAYNTSNSAVTHTYLNRSIDCV